MSIRVYIHEAGRQDADAVDTELDAVIGSALEIDGDEEMVLLLEDDDEAIDIALTFAQASIDDRRHVFRGKRKRIDVVVMYNGERREREFSASTRVERVFRWATGKQGFGLSDVDAAEHALALLDNAMPASDVHLGSLDDKTPGRVEFRLIPKHRYQG
jgi:hypothetical protein